MICILENIETFFFTNNEPIMWKGFPHVFKIIIYFTISLRIAVAIITP